MFNMPEEAGEASLLLSSHGAARRCRQSSSSMALPRVSTAQGSHRQLSLGRRAQIQAGSISASIQNNDSAADKAKDTFRTPLTVPPENFYGAFSLIRGVDQVDSFPSWQSSFTDGL